MTDQRITGSPGSESACDPYRLVVWGTGGMGKITAQVNWMVGRKEMVPAGMPPDDHYFAVIEGTPSLSLGLGIKASMARDQRLMDPSGPTSDPGYWATIAAVLQAVPRVCEAGPGVLDPVVPDLHWRPDFRDLSTASPVSV